MGSLSENSVVNKYLREYAEAEAALLQRVDPDLRWRQVVVMPVCDEADNTLDAVFAEMSAAAHQVLVILVVNRPDAHPSTTVWASGNERLMQSLKRRAVASQTVADHIELLQFTGRPYSHVMLVDRNQPGRLIAAAEGVGLARKVGCDMALMLISRGRIESPWIHSVDADVQLPGKYFDVEKPARAAAISLAFEHVCKDPALLNVQRLYDFKIHYFRLGMAYCDSQYRYIPLGSTLIVNPLAYARVRGVPRRNGGEDFYLLNKLAKIGAVAMPEYPVMRIQARYSDRVPFGTGPGLLKIKQSLDANKTMASYNPKIFIVLKYWHYWLENLWDNGLTSLPNTAELRKLYHHFKFDKVINKVAVQIRDEKRWKQFVHEWMDAFRLLKAVNFLAKTYRPVPLSKLVVDPEFFRIVQDSHSYSRKFLLSFIHNRQVKPQS